MKYLLITLALATNLHANDFIKIQNNYLQTAVSEYKNTTQQVHLFSVVHLADKNYFKQIDKLLESYDVVLYELVAPKNTKPTKSKTHPIITLTLNLHYQLEFIDYSKPNFLHADLDLTDLKSNMQKRNQSTLSLALKVIADSLEQPQNNKKYPTLKSSLAHSLTTSNLKALDQLLIQDRNNYALKILKSQTKPKIAILYGAAHSPHFHENLLKLGFQLNKTTWLNAWNLDD